ncbi:lipid-binding SYLF domain-containing protein [Vibrio sp.]|uniref:lipid-binding SYLF domain-containing protein n=1 Tax=Vibrio sp. TaxID=678 RepID=UPI003D13110D
MKIIPKFAAIVRAPSQRQPIYTLLTAMLVLLFILFINPASAAPPEKNDAEALVEKAQLSLNNFLTEQHWAAVRNLSGVAKAVVIFPQGGQAGLLLGYQWGRGIMLVRHQHDWSDPIFIKLNSFQFGLSVGGQGFSAIGALLSRPALDKALRGDFAAGGSADLTIGPGLSGRAIGGVNGIETLMVSVNRGLYLGGNIEAIRLKLDERYNQLAYGEDFDLDQLLANSRGGDYPPANSIRASLKYHAYQSVYGTE